MAARALGQTGLEVSPLALGTVKLGRNEKLKYPQPFDLPTDQEVERLLERALELGVTCFDTAPAYGSSEERLAPFVARHRDRIVLCTKAGEEFAGGVSTYDFAPRAIAASARRSLQRLGVEQLDVLLLHSDGRDEWILEESGAVDELHRLRRSGLVRAVGISAKTTAGLAAAIACDLDVVMAPFSPTRTELAGALEQAHAAGLGVMAIKALDSGRRPAAEAIPFVLAQPFVDTLVVGTLSADHLEAAVRAAGMTGGKETGA